MRQGDSLAPLFTYNTTNRSDDLIPDHYVVMYRHSVLLPGVLTTVLAQRHGFVPSFRYDGDFPGFAARLTPAAVHAIRRYSDVAFVEQDRRGEVSGTIQANARWALARIDDRANTRDNTFEYNDLGPVAVYHLDTGVRYSHLDFATGRAVPFWDVQGGNAIDCEGHGTATGSGAVGDTSGVAKAGGLFALRITDGCLRTFTEASVMSAIAEINARGAPPAVVLMAANLRGISHAVDSAIGSSISRGFTWVVSAGNQNIDACDNTPAHTLGTITVAASDSNDVRWTSSNFGPCVNLFAPGAYVRIAYYTSDNVYAFADGTSQAAGYVAGVAATYLGRAAPSRTAPSYVKDAIQRNSTLNAVSTVGCTAAGCTPNRLLFSPWLDNLVMNGPSEMAACTSDVWSISWRGGVPPVNIEWWRGYTRINGTWVEGVVGRGSSVVISAPCDAVDMSLEARMSDDIGMTDYSSSSVTILR